MMDKIKINLLPIEFTRSQIERAKFKKVQAVSIIFLLVLTAIAVAVVALRFLQSQEIEKNKTQLETVENLIQGLKNKEVSLTVLKNRLSAINKLTSTPSKQKSLYTLISSLIPAQVSVTSVVIDKNSNLNLSITASDSTAFADFLESLTSVEKNEDRISQVIIDSLSRNKDGSLRVSLKILPK